MAVGNHLWLRALVIALIALCGDAVYGGARQQGGAAQQKPQTAHPSWRVRVNSSAPVTISLRAVNAPMTEIAAELGRQLNVPVTLSPLMRKQSMTLEFNKYPLHAAVNALAPRAFIDYVVGGNNAVQPKCVAIYLQAYNESPPQAGGRGSAIALLVVGDTEEIGDETTTTTAQKAGPPLVIAYDKNQLTVRARKQPLLVVLYEIAIKVGIPFEIEEDSREVVDASFQNYPLDQAISSLSPAARLYYRIDSQTWGITPLRIVLAAPAKS